MARIAAAKISVENQGLAYEILATHKNPNKIKDLKAYVATTFAKENSVVRGGATFSIDSEDWIESADFVEFADKKNDRELLDKTGSNDQEKLLDVLNEAGSAAEIGRKLGLTPRRGQQLVKKAIQRAQNAVSYENGGRGQGDLFFSGAEA